MEVGVLDCVGGIDLLFGQQVAQLPAAAIRPDHSDDRDVVDEFAQIARDIGRAAGVKAFACYLDHRHRRLGRNAAHFAPDKLVQHQVADDEDAFRLGAGQNFSKRRTFMSCKSAWKEIRTMPPAREVRCDSESKF